MADIEVIEQHLRDARAKAEEVQKQLDEHLLDTNGAEDATAAELRTVAHGHQARVAELMRVKLMAESKDAAQELAEEAATARRALQMYSKISPRRIEALKAVDKARDHLKRAIEDAEALESEAARIAKEIVLHSRVRESHAFGALAHVVYPVRTRTADLIRSVLAEGGKGEERLETWARHHCESSERHFAGVVAYIPGPAFDPASIYPPSSYKVLFRRGA